MMPLNQPPTPSPMAPSGGGPTQGVQLHPAVAQAFRQRLMGGRLMGAPGGGIVPPGPKQHNFDDPGGGGPMGGPGPDGRGFGGGGPMPFPPSGGLGLGGMQQAATPYHYTQADMNYGQAPQNNAPGSRLYSANGRPNPAPVVNPWGHGNDPFNVNGPGGPNSYGNPEGPDGRGFGGGGPMPFPPGGPAGNAPGGPWGGNPNSYGPAEGWSKPFGLPNENQMQPFDGAQGMRDRSGPWSRRLGEAPQGPQGWQW